jgi:hypothetical protein
MRCDRAKINNIARARMDMRFQPEISLEKHEDVGYSLALVDYDAQTIFLELRFILMTLRRTHSLCVSVRVWLLSPPWFRPRGPRSVALFIV